MGSAEPSVCSLAAWARAVQDLDILLRRLHVLENFQGCFGAGLQVIWYNASDAKGPAPSNTWDPPSGAYMFRPNGLFTSTAPVRMQVVEGPVLTEIRQARSFPSLPASTVLLQWDSSCVVSDFSF